MDSREFSSDEAYQELARRELLQRQQSMHNQNNNFFQMRNDPSKSLIERIPELRNPSEVGKAALQAGGILGTMIAPELTLMKGASFIPSAINTLGRAGLGGIFGAAANPEHPIEGGIMGSVIPSSINILTKHIPRILTTNKNNIKNTILNAHDALENRASEAFRQVSNEVNKRGINEIPIDKNMISNLDQYFPKTQEAELLINKAKTGDYNSLRKLQSDLYKKAKRNLGAESELDRMRGSEMLEKREHINQAIANHLQNTGNMDLTNILNNARNDYKTLQNIYYHPNMNNSIVNMVNKDYRKIPKNLIDVLNEESKPMQYLKDFHSGLQNSLLDYGRKENILKILSKFGIPASLGGLTLYGLSQLKSNQRNE